ncbi:PadR family transcriptional regulator [Bacillus sp. SM2101]|uniref:PadR family transcriptional regulator n=1 Tax=Bacillus sp. SM2101 TaxID=2805366 RepID=UPI001BDE1586|nr:PadR family transcriptional regulator [Bacillus sp. SM2101]
MTRTMVLGLLKSNGPMSGYEIQRMMESSNTEMWANVKPASIYHALKKLQKEAKVELETVEQTGLRTKSIFRITTKGEAELNRLLIESLATSSVVFPTALYTSLTFIDNISNDEILLSLEKQKNEVIYIYETMKSGYAEKEKMFGSIPHQVKIIFDNMYSQCELQLKCINDMIEFARGGEKSDKEQAKNIK